MKSQRTVRCFFYFAASLLTAHAGTLAQFRTPFGDLEIELYDQQKPATVQNFKRLVQSGAYQYTFFHRVVPGFIAQGGGYFAYNPILTNALAPPWTTLGVVPNFGVVSNEFSIGPKLSNTNGTIAMAKLGNNPDSATSEWFFNLANNSANLDNQNGGFTVFGRVVRDTGSPAYGGVLGIFNSISYTNGLVNMKWWYPADPVATNLFTTLPVTYAGFAPPRLADLVYLDISLLTVRISLTNNLRQISWNSVSGKTNVVEYTSAFPPSWTPLVATNGNGARIAVSDPASTNLFRFYRVRVLY